MTACFHLHTDFVRQCVHLPGAGTGRDHEKVHDRRNTGQIEDNGVFTTILFAQLGNVAGVFQTALQSVLGTGGGDGGGNSKLQGSNQNSQDNSINLWTVHLESEVILHTIVHSGLNVS